MNDAFIKRLKSFSWRFFAYVVAISLTWLTDNLADLQLSPFITTLIGLGLGELSKHWSNTMNLKGKTFFGRIK